MQEIPDRHCSGELMICTYTVYICDMRVHVWPFTSTGCVLPPGVDQCQGSRVSDQGWSQCSHPSSYDPGVGQVLSPAVWWILRPAVDRRHPLFPGVRHPGSHWGRSCRRQCKRPRGYSLIWPIYTSVYSLSHFPLWFFFNTLTIQCGSTEQVSTLTYVWPFVSLSPVVLRYCAHSCRGHHWMLLILSRGQELQNHGVLQKHGASGMSGSLFRCLWTWKWVYLWFGKKTFPMPEMRGHWCDC